MRSSVSLTSRFGQPTRRRYGFGGAFHQAAVLYRIGFVTCVELSCGVFGFGDLKPQDDAMTQTMVLLMSH